MFGIDNDYKYPADLKCVKDDAGVWTYQIVGDDGESVRATLSKNGKGKWVSTACEGEFPRMANAYHASVKALSEAKGASKGKRPTIKRHEPEAEVTEQEPVTA